MEVGESSKIIHIVVVPFPDGEEQINPIFKFSNSVSSKGVKVSILNVTNTDEIRDSTTAVGRGAITVAHRPRAPYKGKEEPESIESRMHHLQTSICFHLTNLITHHQTTTGARIACVVYDSVMPWVLNIARGFGLLGAAFFTQSCAVNAVFYNINRGWLNIPVHDHAAAALSLPALPILRAVDLPSQLVTMDVPHGCQYDNPMIFLRFMIDQFYNEPDWMFINTSHALESQVI